MLVGQVSNLWVVTRKCVFFALFLLASHILNMYYRIDRSTAYEGHITAIDDYSKPGSEQFIPFKLPLL